jgi:hypothetical protein
VGDQGQRKRNPGSLIEEAEHQVPGRSRQDEVTNSLKQAPDIASLHEFFENVPVNGTPVPGNFEVLADLVHWFIGGCHDLLPSCFGARQSYHISA